jgi:hypothetical protein
MTFGRGETSSQYGTQKMIFEKKKKIDFNRLEPMGSASDGRKDVSRSQSDEGRLTQKNCVRVRKMTSQ